MSEQHSPAPDAEPDPDVLQKTWEERIAKQLIWAGVPEPVRHRIRDTDGAPQLIGDYVAAALTEFESLPIRRKVIAKCNVRIQRLERIIEEIAVKCRDRKPSDSPPEWFENQIGHYRGLIEGERERCDLELRELGE